MEGVRKKKRRISAAARSLLGLGSPINTPTVLHTNAGMEGINLAPQKCFTYLLMLHDLQSLCK